MYHSVEVAENLNAKGNHSINIHACHLMPRVNIKRLQQVPEGPSPQPLCLGPGPETDAPGGYPWTHSRTNWTLAGTPERTFIIFFAEKSDRTACRGQ